MESATQYAQVTDHGPVKCGLAYQTRPSTLSALTMQSLLEICSPTSCLPREALGAWEARAPSRDSVWSQTAIFEGAPPASGGATGWGT